MEEEDEDGRVGGGGFQICWFALGKVDLVGFEGSHQFRCEIFIHGGGHDDSAHVLALREGVWPAQPPPHTWNYPLS